MADINADKAHVAATLDDLDDLWQLIATSSDLQRGLTTGLKLIVKALERQGGFVVFHPPLTGDAPIIGAPMMAQHQIPATWQEIMSRVGEYPGGVDCKNAESVSLLTLKLPDLAGWCNLGSEEGSCGWVFLYGHTLSVDENEQLNQLAGQFYQALTLNVQKPVREDVISLPILLSIVNSQNTLKHDDQIQILVARSLFEICKASAVTIIIQDFENPEIVKKSVYTGEASWGYQNHFTLKDGLVSASIKTRQSVFTHAVADTPGYNPDFDGFSGTAGFVINSLVIMPLVNEDHAIGAIEIINSEELFQDSYLYEYVHIFVTSLTNSLCNKKLVHDFKIVNADLEASRLELMKSRNMLRSLFDHLPASLYIVDRNYIIQSINMHRSDRAHELPNRLWGRKCYEVLYNRPTACEGCRVKETLNLGTNTIRNSREQVNDQRFIEWEINTYPINDSRGQASLAILFEQDVSDRRQLEASLLQNEKLAIVGQLAAGVAHEINNPLAAIIANVQLIKREGAIENESIAESVNLIDIASLRASQVVTNLLSFSRKEQLQFEPCDLNLTVKKAVALVQHEFLVRPTHVKLELSDNLPNLNGSKENLQAVWTNLLLNGLDAMNHDHREIRIRTSIHKGDFYIEFQDNGQGIPVDRIPMIFEPFYTTKVSGRGTGLGLSVCQQVIKQHSGYLKVESTVGVGTRFTAIIPLDPKKKLRG